MEEISGRGIRLRSDRRLRLANRAGERLLARPVESDCLAARTRNWVCAQCLGVGGPTILPVTFPAGPDAGKCDPAISARAASRSELLVMTDVSQSLRDEERQAWQRLIRVIGHEINNSLAPIRSIAHSLERILSRDPRPPDWETDMRAAACRWSAPARIRSGGSRPYALAGQAPRAYAGAGAAGHSGGSRCGTRACARR